MRTSTTILAATILSACATTTWEKPGATEADFERDKYECIKDGEQHAANQGFGGNPFIVAQRAKECMRVKGYTERGVAR